MIDLAISLALVASLPVLAIAYAARVAAGGRLRAARLDQVGSSVLLGAGAREAFYWGIGPLARLCARLGVSPDAITIGSLGVGVVAAVAIATGHDGVGAALLALSCLGDALDGYVARARRVASGAGEVVDAIADRYQEIVVLGALLLRFRHDLAGASIALGALAGSLMVSYVTAKAEAMGVEPPRGVLRRAERAAWLTVAVASTPIAAWATRRFELPSFVPDAPELAVLAVFAVVGNASSVLRSAEIVEALRSREKSRVASAATSAEVPPTPSCPEVP